VRDQRPPTEGSGPSLAPFSPANLSFSLTSRFTQRTLLPGTPRDAGKLYTRVLTPKAGRAQARSADIAFDLFFFAFDLFFFTLAVALFCKVGLF